MGSSSSIYLFEIVKNHNENIFQKISKKDLMEMIKNNESIYAIKYLGIDNINYILNEINGLKLIKLSNKYPYKKDIKNFSKYEEMNFENNVVLIDRIVYLSNKIKDLNK